MQFLPGVMRQQFMIGATPTGSPPLPTYGVSPIGIGTSPMGIGTAPIGIGTAPIGIGTSPMGIGTAPIGIGTSPIGIGTSPIGIGTSPIGTSVGGPPSQPPQQLISVAQRLASDKQLARLVLERKPRTMIELIHIVGGGVQPYTPPYESQTYPYTPRDNDNYYSEGDIRQPVLICFGRFTIIMDPFLNVKLMWITGASFGSVTGWCWNFFGFGYFPCSESLFNVAWFVC